MNIFRRVLIVSLLCASVLIAPRHAHAQYSAYCPDVRAAAESLGGQFNVVGNVGPLYGWMLWNYQVTWGGEVFYGTCIE